MLMFALLLMADDGFGGAAGSAPAPKAGECVIRGDDGVWRTCADALALKRAARDQAEADAVVPTPEPPQAPVVPVEEKPPEKKKVQLQIDLEKAGVDPTQPLLALRIRVLEIQDELEFLDDHGYPEHRKIALQTELQTKQLLLADVEQMAMTRLLQCARNMGHPIELKRVRMTLAGPVPLSMGEIIAQLPTVDPPGCSRISMVDADSVAKIQRAHELYVTLKTKSFGFYEVDQRRALEQEQKALDAWLAKEGIAPLKGRIPT